MKKITLLFFMISLSVFSQETKIKAYLEKTETISFDQYDLIKKVNQFYPDILVSKQVKNTFKNDLKTNELIESYLVLPTPTDCSDYSVLIYPDNSAVDYSYQLKDKAYVFGNVRLFNGSVYRTYFSAEGNKRISRYYIDGKLINEQKN
ncbi:hypothetical protein [Flavobacterium sp. K5-23]|uniref:hypothetical protein n=1 Tax=Flavobacterium sp. K5-23 TaxID=2746225 RepID=UPI002010079F|nr:hypothetical protein [Flavobacterium sp. K5-23]UQD57000.1 hypothetical protein FLAK523_11625 [Flavobacterium sp. K5-23]